MQQQQALSGLRVGGKKGQAELACFWRIDEDSSWGRSICGRPLEQNGITSRDLRSARLSESMFFGNGEGARKVLGGDVALGFRNEEICPRFERGSESSKEGLARGNFVNNSEQ